jgi:hypothetical protein
MKLTKNIFFVLITIKVVSIFAMEITPVSAPLTLQQQLALWQQTYKILEKKFNDVKDKINPKYIEHAKAHQATARTILTNIEKNLNGGNYYIGEEENVDLLYDPKLDLNNAISNINSLEDILNKQIREPKEQAKQLKAAL